MKVLSQSEIFSKSVKLASGDTIPILGIGTWKLKGSALKEVIEKGIHLGYRLIDGAAIYENEQEVGKVLHEIVKNKDFNVKREDLFVVSKLWNTKHSREDVFEACERTLKDLQLEYLDLYLIHWPFSFEADEKGFSRYDENGVAIVKSVPLSETWSAMEELVQMKKVKSIGVSNFTICHLKEILKVAKVKPSVNQVEMHPYLPQPNLLRFCHENDIQVVAYSPLGSGGQPSLLEDSKLKELSGKLKLTPAQLLLSWAVTRGTIVIPKTSSAKRVEENCQLATLDEESIKLIDDISKEKHCRFIDPVNIWKRDCFDEDC